MPVAPRRALLAIALSGGLALSPLAVSHFDDKEILQSYRQSWFALLAANFGPMVSMLEGEMPWDEQRLGMWSEQLVQLTSMDVSRGFSPGSEKGTTRAKPEIWENPDDFNDKMEDLHAAALELEASIGRGDREAIAAEIAATGEACKACHDEYKSEDYLY